MTESHVLFSDLSCKGGSKIGIATLNAQKSLNALNIAMIGLLVPQLKKWQQDDSVKCVWLQGKGDKAFCAGGDVVSLYASSAAYGEALTNDDSAQFFSQEYTLDYYIHRYPKPIIAWGHGVVMGGGLGLMVGASHRVATETTRIAMPEVTIGLYPDVGSSWFLQRTVGKVGLFMGLTGAIINAADAEFAGLVDYLIASSDKDNILNDLTSTNLDHDTSATVKAILQRYTPKSDDTMPAANVNKHYRLINKLCQGGNVKEICQRLLDYQTEDKWLNRAINTLRYGCPITPHLVMAQIKRGINLSLVDIFRMELVMSRHCAAKGHFKEGVRALLIDKDRKPKWAHNSLFDVTKAEVDAFFQPFNDDPLASLETSIKAH